MFSSSIFGNDKIIDMNGNGIDCCVRYRTNNNNELEGYFFTNVKIAIPLTSPTFGNKWDAKKEKEDVMGLPIYE